MSCLMMHVKNILRKNLQMQIVVATFVLTIYYTHYPRKTTIDNRTTNLPHYSLHTVLLFASAGSSVVRL